MSKKNIMIFSRTSSLLHKGYEYKTELFVPVEPYIDGHPIMDVLVDFPNSKYWGPANQGPEEQEPEQ